MGKKSTPGGVSDALKQFGQIGQLSESQAREQLDWASERQGYDQEQWRANQGRMEGILDDQLGFAEESMANSRADRQRYEELYQPIEEDYLNKVNAWDSPERRTSEAGKAGAEVASQQEAARQNALRRLESYGVDPSQTRNSAMDAGIRVEEAKQKALAANTARTDVEKTGMALREGTIGAGRDLTGQSNRGAQMGAGAIPTYGQGAGEMYSQGNQAIGNWGDSADAIGGISNADQGNKNAAASNTASSVLGAAGMAAMFMADGGEITGPGGPTDDAIPIAASDGEFMIPADVVKRKGTEFFDKLIEKVKTENAEREQNAQVTADAMAVPPPEAIPPEGMGMPMPGMNKGGEIRRPLMFNRGGEVVGYADGGEVRTPMNYPPPPGAQMGAI